MVKTALRHKMKTCRVCDRGRGEGPRTNSVPSELRDNDVLVFIDALDIA